MSKKICIVVGTRPEIIKMSPLIRECRTRSLPFYIVHTGQHYSHNMDNIFLEELELPTVDYHLEVGSGTHGKQTGLMLEKIEQVLTDDPPAVVLVQGDTNTVLAASLAATKLHIPVGHVEAGLRSYDRSMPEEINRILADHMSDFLFTPTNDSADRARQEGIPEEKVFTTGNTVVDSALQNAQIAQQKSTILKQLHIKPKQFILATMHRAENTDHADRLKSILQSFKTVSSELAVPLIFPMHPRTKKQIAAFGFEELLETIPNIHVTEPVGFLDFLILESQAQLIMTDSGGVQEEACIFKVPCVTLRDNTERQESVAVGASVIAGADHDTIVRSALDMAQKNTDWKNPFGDGTAAAQIISVLEEHISGLAPNEQTVHASQPQTITQVATSIA